MVVVTVDVDADNISKKIIIDCIKPCGDCHHDIARLTEEKCARRVWIPARHLTESKGDKMKAMKLFLEELEA